MSDCPKKVFRGLDLSKDKSSGISQIEALLIKGYTSSHSLMINEGEFDFERMRKRVPSWEINETSIEKYSRMVQENSLNPEDIDDNLRYEHWMYMPSPLVSVTSSLMIGAKYSGWVLRPILVYSTDNLEGIDFRNEPQDCDGEIGIFKALPNRNLTDIIYFFENPNQMKSLLSKFEREDIRLHQGFLKPDFRYVSTSGKECFNVPSDLLYNQEFQDFYKSKEESLLRI